MLQCVGIHAARYSALRNEARYTARRDDRVSCCTLKRTNQKRCWADLTQMRMLLVEDTSAHFFACFALSPMIRSAIF